MHSKRLTKLLILAVGLFGVLAFLCAGCQSPPRAIPKAINRDARGRFITPVCPVCGAPAALSCTAWRCERGHKYESPDIELGDGENKPVEHCGAR